MCQNYTMESIDEQVAFPGLLLPKDYKSILEALPTAHALQQIKNLIELNLETEMQLHRVSGPLFVQKGTGINDELNGVEHPVEFPIREMGNIRAEVVQSLAKWKRLALAEYEIPVHEGVYTNMNAIRAHEQPDSLHSLYVDQWDWEQRIRAEDRNLTYLKRIVKKLYFILKRTEIYMQKQYGIAPELPEDIYFIQAEDLMQRYPKLTGSERENEIVKEHGAVFIIGIGGELSNGEPHDGRSPDYDDWSTPSQEGYKGLNGDILIWHPVLKKAVEISSMGIRVDRESLLRQLDLRDENHRKDLLYHKRLLNGELPYCIGGGIGQSRLGMYFLRKAHIGEVSSGIWPEEMIALCRAHHINLI